MKEHPIIFNASMVRAILGGQKTQTRRIIKPQPFDRSWFRRDHNIEIVSGRAERGDEIDGLLAYTKSSGGEWHAKCPFGQLGDHLWVRETWAILGNEEGCCVDWNDKLRKGDEKNSARIYRASCEQRPGDYGLWSIPDDADWKPHTENQKFEGAWRPSIHMPRWASRITLEITDVRVERLQDISEEDAQAEGVESLRGGYWRHYQPEWTQHQLSARGSFVTLWKSLYGEESWQANLWVWVIEFKCMEGKV